jgi:hypothetical protein
MSETIEARLNQIAAAPGIDQELCRAEVEILMENIPRTDVIRQKARGVNVEVIKQGAMIARCEEDHPDFGWVVITVVRSRESVDRIVAFWEPRVERCRVIDFDAVVSRWRAANGRVGTFSVHFSTLWETRSTIE